MQSFLMVFMYKGQLVFYAKKMFFLIIPYLIIHLLITLSTKKMDILKMLEAYYSLTKTHLKIHQYFLLA